jgi:hypothetical protein
VKIHRSGQQPIFREVNRGARDSERILIRALDIVTLSQAVGDSAREVDVAHFGAPYRSRICRAGLRTAALHSRTVRTISTARGRQASGRPDSEECVAEPADRGSLGSTRGRPQLVLGDSDTPQLIREMRYPE